MERTENVVFENIVEEMSDGILIIGFDGKIRMENTVVSDILGIPKDRLYGKTIASFMEEDDKNDEFFRCIIDAVYSKKNIRETAPYFINGERKFFRIVTSFLKDKEDDVALIALIGDITELVELNWKNQQLNKKLMSVLDSFVNVMISAIDERTPYNATHTKKMVGYAERFMEWMIVGNKLENYKNKAPFIMSVWMHDLGKLVIPRGIMDKQTRLSYHEGDVLHRAEIGIMCERLKAAENSEYADKAAEKIKAIEDATELVKRVNGLGFADDETKRQIEAIADLECLTSSGKIVPLLNEYEREALSVTKGNLTEEERLIMESHAAKTKEMLLQLNLDGSYSKVPEWASMHHEYLDGSGYPDGLTAEVIPWEVRVLTVIDIYDALTAEDRPYKPPMPPEKAFAVLYSMADEGKLDREVIRDFYDSGAWNNKEV